MICPFPLFKKKKDTTSGTATYYTQGNGTIHGAIGKHTQQEHYAVTKPHTLALPRGALHDTSQIHDAPPSHIFVYLFIYFLVRLAARVTIHVVKCRQVVPLPISPSGKTNKQKTLPCVSYLPSPHTDARTHTGKKKKHGAAASQVQKVITNRGVGSHIMSKWQPHNPGGVQQILHHKQNIPYE